MTHSTTPPGDTTRRSGSRSRRPTSRPTTPLRPSSRSSLRDSGKFSNVGQLSPLEALEPAFAELSDSMADLEANFMHLQLMHESLSRFSESFASFLYGLNMNAFCVDFPEAPIQDSFRRSRPQDEHLSRFTNSDKIRRDDFDSETTFMTTDTSFVDNPSISAKAMPDHQTSAPLSRIAGATRKASATRGGAVRGGTRGTRGSSLARARGYGVR